MKTILKPLNLVWFAAVILSIGPIGYADDIDLFTGGTPTEAGAENTLLLVWNTQGSANASIDSADDDLCYYLDDKEEPSLKNNNILGMEQCALVNALVLLKEDIQSASSDSALLSLKIGLMVQNQNLADWSGKNGNQDCGYLLYAPKKMAADDLGDFGVDDLIDAIKNVPSGLGANSNETGNLIAEAWSVLNGLSYSCSGVSYSSLADDLNCNDPAIFYLGTATKTSTANNVADGNIGSNPAGTTPQDMLLRELAGSNDGTGFSYVAGSQDYERFAPRIFLDYATNNSQNSTTNSFFADEWTRFMRNVDVEDSPRDDRNVTTFAAAVIDDEPEEFPRKFIRDVADQGGGDYYEVNSTDHAGLSAAIGDVIKKVLDVDSVFTSASLPVSANAQEVFLNQIFIAMFQPDADAGPRWMGNVKQYQLGYGAGGSLVLADSDQDPDDGLDNDVSATNPVTGTIVSDAISFWTKNFTDAEVADWPVDGFWENAPEGDGLAFDSPDGPLVQKGGASQILRANNLTSSAARVVFTCLPDASCSTSSFDSFDDSQASLLAEFDTALASQSNVDVSAGDSNVGTVTSSTCKTNGNDPSCTVSVIDVTVLLSRFDASTDAVLLYGEANGICSVTAPCPVISSTSTTVTFTVPKNSTVSPNGTKLGLASKEAFVTPATADTALFTAGDPLEFISCTPAAVGEFDYDVNADTDGDFGSSPVTADFVSTTSGGFTVILDDYLLTGKDISCDSVKGTLTAENLINWVRGDDVAGNEALDGPCPFGSDPDVCPVTVRGSIHGDVLHSRPAIINYADSDAAAPETILFYGSNDGHFRAINGNKTESITGGGRTVRAGGELWSFIAPEFFESLPRLYRNYPLVDYPGVTDSVIDPEPRNYFFDGTTATLEDTRSVAVTGKTHFIFPTARRGGRFLYAINVSDPFTPKFAWKLSETELPEMGYSWSEPKVTLLKNYADPVLIFGLGYDPLEDDEPAGTNTMGRGIAIVDAISGSLLWTAVPSCTGVPATATCLELGGLTKSFPADMTLLDRNGDGFIERLYAVDTGANVWRIDLEATGVTADAPFASIAMKQIASLGDVDGDAGADARKFLFAADVVPTTYFDAVVVSSGDREHPLYENDSYDVENKFFMIMDRNITLMPDVVDVVTIDELQDQNVQDCYFTDADTGSTSIADCTADDQQRVLFDGSGSDALKGFFFDFNVGEKGVNAPLSIGGKVYFGTNQPDVPAADSCYASLGIARGYEVDLFSGTVSGVKIFAGGGMPPSPIAGLVQIGDKVQPFCFGCFGSTILDPIDPTPSISGKVKKEYLFFD